MPKIRVFSTPVCPYCHTLKAFLKEHGFDFEDLNVAKDEKAREELVRLSGKMEVPIIDIDGEIIAGFDKVKIEKKLKINK